jgi:predicted RNA-binding protein with PIN domain
MKTMVIDGHNLIPKIPGLSLEDPEDESKLLEVLNQYCRLSKTHVELFFDGAPLGLEQKPKQGLIRVHMVRKGLSADDAIVAFIRGLGNNARNITVISSDRRVQVEVKSLQANVISSEAFSTEIRKALSSPQAEQETRERTLTTNEIEQWEEVFRTKKG